MKKYSIRKNWLTTIEVMRSKPVVIMPFVVVAFLECLALEIIYFAQATPIRYITNPIIKKFFGEAFLHYPGTMMALPRLFYYAQSAIYIVVGALLAGICVNIFKNTVENLPIKTNAVVKNGIFRYFSFAFYAVFVLILIALLGGFEAFIVNKGVRFLARHNLLIPKNLYMILSAILLFFTNILLQVFIILTIPIMVLRKKSLFKSILQSFRMGFFNFPKILTILTLPFIVYLPVIFLKTFAMQIAQKTYPGINFYITLLGIILTIFIDSFIILSVSRFLLDSEKPRG